MATILISVLLFIALFFAARKMISDFRSGGCPSCGGSCPHCSAQQSCCNQQKK